ncbi:Uncharacterised protein [Yersinia kristensenii]|nr:Uncharacterised protein [Yersinia kristensenii]
MSNEILPELEEIFPLVKSTPPDTPSLLALAWNLISLSLVMVALVNVPIHELLELDFIVNNILPAPVRTELSDISIARHPCPFTLLLSPVIRVSPATEILAELVMLTPIWDATPVLPSRVRLPTSYRPPLIIIRVALLSSAYFASKPPLFNKILPLFNVITESAVELPANKLRLSLPALDEILLLTAILPSACNVSVASPPAVLLISALTVILHQRQLVKLLLLVVTVTLVPRSS